MVSISSLTTPLPSATATYSVVKIVPFQLSTRHHFPSVSGKPYARHPLSLLHTYSTQSLIALRQPKLESALQRWRRGCGAETLTAPDTTEPQKRGWRWIFGPLSFLMVRLNGTVFPLFVLSGKSYFKKQLLTYRYEFSVHPLLLLLLFLMVENKLLTAKGLTFLGLSAMVSFFLWIRGQHLKLATRLIDEAEKKKEEEESKDDEATESDAQDGDVVDDIKSGSEEDAITRL